MGKDNDPLNDHANERTLDFITREDRRQFMADDPIHAINHYIKQATRQAEFVRSFGMDGARLNALKNEAMTTYGATADDISLVNDYIAGALGNKEVGMSRELKDLYGAMSVYQNFRLLPFSLFSSLIDPLGIAVRSNSISDAWSTFAYSVKNMFNDWKSNYTRDEWQQLAEDWGIIEDHGTTLNANTMYDGDTMRGKTKELNDALFKYNLLNGWIRNNTIMATKAAQRFMYRASQGFFKEHSDRYLSELGVTKDDIIFDQSKDRILLRSEELAAHFKAQGLSDEAANARAEQTETRLKNATDKFVRQSLLNPSSAELPNWASNPYFMPIAHLKQFVFAFSATINDRILNEAKEGNLKPMLIATAYVPGMIASTYLKDLISNFGDEPPYKKDWGVVDYLQDGVNRSGLTGTGQFFASAKSDIMHGGHGYENLAGPSLEQFMQLGKAATSDKPGDMWNWAVRAMPLMPAYDQWLLTNQAGGGSK